MASTDNSTPVAKETQQQQQQNQKEQQKEKSNGSEKQQKRRPWSEEELQDCFYVFDSDGNGFIDSEELLMACKMLGYNDEDAKKVAQEIKTACDENKDNKISWDEFRKNFASVM